MIVFGLIGVIFSCILYSAIGPIIYEETKENIFLHLQGNTMLFDNFYQVTQCRGVLKVDFLANVEFASCLIFIIVLDMLSEEHKEYTNIPVWVSYIVVATLLLLIGVANWVGGTVSVSTNSLSTNHF